MFIASLHVLNFRCIANATLYCESLTALLGPNGCGKSTFLKAIEFFFSVDTRVLDEDFFNRDTTSDIEITIEFRDVDPAHTLELGSYLQGHSLKVTRVYSWNQNRVSSKFYGYTERHGGSASIRDANGATQQKEIYENLKNDSVYEDLPRWTKQADLSVNLKQWEDNHPRCCDLLRDDGTFLGVGATAKFDLGKLVQLVFIPAVRDAGAGATDMRGSPITELLDIAFRSGIAEREDFRTLQADVKVRYGEIIEDAKQVQLRQVEKRLSQTMATFVTNTNIRLDWRQPEEVRLPSLIADVLIAEDEYESPVSRTGHGIQRAFTLALLQEIAAVRSRLRQSSTETPTSSRPSLPMLLLIIEEPELFQYPNRVRSIAKTLQELSSGSVVGVAEQTQVIFGTHNALFLAISRVEQVRVLRRVHLRDGAPKATVVKRFNPEAFMEELAACKGPNDSAHDWSFHRMKLVSIMTPEVNEGFFAKGIILVEGDIDRAGIMAACTLENLNLEDVGVSVIQCRGKANLVRLSIIFRQLGIDVFVVWDGDAHKNGDTQECRRRQRENDELYRMVGVDPINPPVTQITDRFACFQTNFGKQVGDDLGDFYLEFMQKAREQYGIGGSDAIKHPVVFEDLLRAAHEKELSSMTLNVLVRQIGLMASRL